MQHCNHVLLYLIIGETQDAKSKTLKRSGAPGIAVGLILVARAIDLDD